MKKMILVVLAVLLVFGVSGCGVVSDNVITDLHGNTTNKHGMLIAGVVEDNKNRLEGQKPVLSLVAQPGQTIMLSGVESLEVWGEAPQLARVEPYVSQGYRLAERALEIALYPFFAWMMADSLIAAIPEATTPFVPPTADPFVPRTELPFVPPVVQ